MGNLFIFLTLKATRFNFGSLRMNRMPLILALLAISCHSGHGRTDDKSTDGKPVEMPGNISFLFPSKGYAYDHRHELIQQCLAGIRHDLQIINQPAFTDTFAIRFLDSRQEMKMYTGIPASGGNALNPRMI